MNSNSSSFSFECGNDIVCNSCKSQWDVDWDTEYGDPCIGEHYGDCPKCGKRIDFGCYIEYTTRTNEKLSE